MKKLLLASAVALALAPAAMAGQVGSAVVVTQNEATASNSFASPGFGVASNTSVAGNYTNVTATSVSGNAKLQPFFGVQGSTSNVTGGSIGGSTSMSQTLGHASANGGAAQSVTVQAFTGGIAP